jgi:MFS family permease
VGLNSALVKSTVVAALGGLLFGFDTAVIAGVTGALSIEYHLSPASLGLTVSIALWGTIVGAMLAGIPGDRWGRRDSLRIMAVLYFGAGADVHRGGGAGKMAGAAGGLLPV